MNRENLHYITARFNPIGWEKPEQHFKNWVEHKLDTGAASVTVAEVQYGARPFTCNVPHVNHLGLRSNTSPWSKENALNLAVQYLLHTGQHVEYVAWEDADTYNRNPNIVDDTLNMLQRFPVVQTWSQVLDLGPNGTVHTMARSFADVYVHKGPVVVENDSVPGWWKHDGGPYDYAHSGFNWAAKLEFLNQTGGFFEVGGMGSGDYHMACGMVGKAEWSLIAECSPSYRRHLLNWQARARQYLNGRLGCVAGTIEHQFHGSKVRRGYMTRWDMFAKHGFDPDMDLKRNAYGVLEWTGNKPELERDWELYLRSRREDDNCN